MPGAPAPSRPWRKADAGNVAEHRVVSVGDLAAFGDDIVEAAQLRRPERSLERGDAVVVAEHGDVVFPDRAGALIGGARHPMIAQLANAVGDAAIVGEARATFTGGHLLHRDGS